MRIFPTVLMATTLALSPAAFATDRNTGASTSGNLNSTGTVAAESTTTGRGKVDPTGMPTGANARGSNDASNSGTGIGRGQVDPTGKTTGSADRNSGMSTTGNSASGIGRGQVDPSGRPTESLAGRADVGKLNAAHASLTGQTNAAPNSAVGHIRSYEEAKVSAVAMPQITATDRSARVAAIARANALLEPVANKPVTPAVVAQVDSILGINSSM